MNLIVSCTNLLTDRKRGKKYLVGQEHTEGLDVLYVVRNAD